MKVCLDTNAYSRLMLGHAPLKNLLESVDEILVPATVLGELHAGFELGSRRQANCEKLSAFLRLPGVVLLVVDEGVAERYGSLVSQLSRAGTPIPTNDIWIAAAAMECGARLVTYDAHFGAVPGLLVLAP
jgi:tRNA(fMet)-specific endonuclease VapC